MSIVNEEREARRALSADGFRVTANLCTLCSVRQPAASLIKVVWYGCIENSFYSVIAELIHEAMAFGWERRDLDGVFRSYSAFYCLLPDE